MKNLVLCLTIVLALCVTNSLAQKVSQQIQKQIVKQMVSNGDIGNACVKEQGGALKVVEVKSLNLNNDKQPEYLIEGNGCACSGARSCDTWIYQRSGDSYKKIFGGEQASVTVLKTRTGGYIDLTAATPFGPNGIYKFIFKFDGSSYRARNCYECEIVNNFKEKCTPFSCN